ncbi:dolichyl-phosphate beta-glucosyltransferase [Coccinella septempunctata]|uniref:dolichyl-phosphate beta-glucosyltransferase n=1 Tax=Coccinella septempunctata TaxID=41139 RepID=UPI001D06435E|nr:dolichyl-phosphate beta-glucosyltransferase [Coccinella septempunctata]
MFNVNLVIFYASGFAASILLSICIFFLATAKQYPFIKRTKKEKCFVNPSTAEVKEFPSLKDECSLDLSVIVPAYNEEARLPSMLEECIDYLENSSKNYEIIVVSDGSTDGTVSVANKFCVKIGTNKLRVLELETNRGKGGAVRLGMLSARGALLLFADADGATKFSDYSKVENAMKNVLKVSGSARHMAVKPGIVIGSRAHLEKESIAQRSIFRTILMYGFHAMVWMFAVKGIKDTQCGFKLFTRKAALDCFESLHVERWAFDVELLKIAQSLKIPIAEVPVNWREIEGSKVTPVLSWIEMAFDLALIWLRYTIGAWKIKAEYD